MTHNERDRFMHRMTRISESDAIYEQCRERRHLDRVRLGIAGCSDIEELSSWGYDLLDTCWKIEHLALKLDEVEAARVRERIREGKGEPDAVEP